MERRGESRAKRTSLCENLGSCIDVQSTCFFAFFFDDLESRLVPNFLSDLRWGS
jgi:hypothetical protein